MEKPYYDPNKDQFSFSTQESSKIFAQIVFANLLDRDQARTINWTCERIMEELDTWGQVMDPASLKTWATLLYPLIEEAHIAGTEGINPGESPIEPM